MLQLLLQQEVSFNFCLHSLYQILKQMFSFFLAQILQEANDDLEERMKNTEKELQEATAEMDKMTDEYTKLKVGLCF